MKKKLRVGVIFGGRSAEHEVSLVSGQSVIKALDPKKYEIIPIGITKSGQWLIGKPLKALKSGQMKQVQIVLPPSDIKQHGLINIGKKEKSLAIDVFFPVLHGPYGEDGTIQGLLELSNIPYVGAGVLGSALGMDKVVQKQLFVQAKIPTPKFVFFKKSDWQKNHIKCRREIKKQIGFPCFVKPANLGSSVGISKAHTEKELVIALNLAFVYDQKVIVEKSIERSREIEMALLGNDEPKASGPGEVISSNEFYDYDAKYIDGRSKTIVPADLPLRVVNKLKVFAVKAFKVLECAGMARADFLVTKKNSKIYLNELNTIPGFTSISMYPKLWQASGLTYQALIDELIRLAILKHKEKSQLKTSYKPKKGWYK